MGGVIRRAKSDVEQYSSLQEVVDEAEKHGLHVVETGDQIVVLCHQGTLHIHSYMKSPGNSPALLPKEVQE